MISAIPHICHADNLQVDHDSCFRHATYLSQILSSQKELNILKSKGAVGDVCLRFFDTDGQVVHSEIDDRVMGISLEELKKIDRVVGVTGGPKKFGAIRAALKGKIINVLVTDHLSAKRVLEE